MACFHAEKQSTRSQVDMMRHGEVSSRRNRISAADCDWLFNFSENECIHDYCGDSCDIHQELRYAGQGYRYPSNFLKTVATCASRRGSRASIEAAVDSINDCSRILIDDLDCATNAIAESTSTTARINAILDHALSTDNKEYAIFFPMDQSSTLTDLPEENLILVASYLPIEQVRVMASTSHSIRTAMLASHGALKSIWMNALDLKFPSVFRHITPDCSRASRRCGLKATSNCKERVKWNEYTPTSEVALVDDFQLAIPAMDNNNGHERDTDTTLNLPLLAVLLPSRYPQAIDPKAFYVEGAGKESSFRSYTLAINLNNGTVVHPSNRDQDKVGNGILQDQSDSTLTNVSVLQFTETPGKGNRSVLSDQPFPPNCHKSSSYIQSSRKQGLPSGITSWIKNHSSHVKRRRSYRAVSAHSSSFGVNNLCGSDGPGGHLKSSLPPPALSSKISVAAPYAAKSSRPPSLTSSPFRFPYSATHLRPYVIPTVITDSNVSTNHLVVDLTPRMVAYFEATVVNQGQVSPQDVGRPNHLQRLSTHSMQQPTQEHHHQQQNQDEENQLNNRRQEECIAIGLTTSSFDSSTKMPGWVKESYGYHGDDGTIFEEGKKVSQDAPSFGPGDTVGVGLDYVTRRVFFTNNGKLVRFSSLKVKKNVVERGLFPTIGVDTSRPIFINFGQQPFKFDIRGGGSSF
ncbi:hypothetical protein ACHAWF_017007 [Thalassiosira exigua]